MCRLARGWSSESQPLYGTFMRLLSSCLFEWDEGGFGNLMAAKREELVWAGVNEPWSAVVKKAVSKEELVHHCKRKTKGTSDTTETIEALVLAGLPATDSLGIKLFNDDMMSIWREQQKRVTCMQGPPGISCIQSLGVLTRKG